MIDSPDYKVNIFDSVKDIPDPTLRYKLTAIEKEIAPIEYINTSEKGTLIFMFHQKLNIFDEIYIALKLIPEALTKMVNCKIPGLKCINWSYSDGVQVGIIIISNFK